jgi:branched-chain amino acid transport system permease protein
MIQVLVNGLVNGAILTLMAISVTIIFGVLRVPHFGLGGIFVWGAFITYFAGTTLGLNFLTAMLFSATLTAILGVVIEKTAFKRLRGATEDAMFVSAIGVLIALENGAHLIWGEQTRSIPFPLLNFVLSIPGVLYLPAMRVLIFMVVGLVTLGLHFYVKKTKMGKAMRAVAQNRIASCLLGVPIDRVASYTFAFGSAMAGMAGALVGTAFTFSFDMGTMSVLKAFVVVVLGGLGSIGGAIIGGFILGIIDSLTLTFLTSQYKYLVSFSLIILVLVLRPSGIFGQKLSRPQ